MSGEVWRPVAGYEDGYEVSDRGRVRSIECRVARCNGTDRQVRERILRPMVQRRNRYGSWCSAMAVCSGATMFTYW